MAKAYRLAALLAVLAVGMCEAPPAKAQGMPVPAFPIAPDPSILILPLILITVPLLYRVSRPDVDRLRTLEARGDWEGAVALASRRLGAEGDDPVWRELRGRALQKMGRCGEAVSDLRSAFEAHIAPTGAADAAAFESGLRLGECEMALAAWPSALETLARLSALAPLRWEPDYHRAMIGARRGDRDEALAPLSALLGKNPAMAEVLQAYLDAPAAPPAASAGDPAAAPPPMSESRLAIGRRVLVLPPGRWHAAPSSLQVMHGSSWSGAAAKTTEVPATTLRAWALSASGGVDAVVSYTANQRQALGTPYWDAPDDCRLRGTLLVERFGSGVERPECLTVRLVGDDDGAAAELAPALAAARQAGVAPSPRSYEVHYARWVADEFVAVTWLLPVERLQGDAMAVEWARALAAELRPLAMAGAGAPRIVVAPLPMPRPLPAAPT